MPQLQPTRPCRSYSRPGHAAAYKGKGAPGLGAPGLGVPGLGVPGLGVPGFQGHATAYGSRDTHATATPYRVT